MGRFRPIACPECFTNQGFRTTVQAHAQRHPSACPQCGAEGDLKIGKRRLEAAVVEFFVGGSYVTETYAPVYQVNDRNPHPARFDPTLSDDAALACHLTGLVVFHYGPPLWRLGMTNHYYDFEEGGEARRGAAEQLVSAANAVRVATGTSLYRLRLNISANEEVATATTFDPPSASARRVYGRWDDSNFPVLYVSDDIELCLHECRTAISDEIVVATLVPTRDLRLLDLSSTLKFNGGTPFDDPNIFVGIMCRSRGRWLEYCRNLARAAAQAGYDGIRYPSYYSQAKHANSALNLALFGRPIEQRVLKIQSVNRLSITDMAYKFRFGPALYKDAEMRALVSEGKQKVKKFRQWLKRRGIALP